MRETINIRCILEKNCREHYNLSHYSFPRKGYQLQSWSCSPMEAICYMKQVELSGTGMDYSGCIWTLPRFPFKVKASWSQMLVVFANDLQLHATLGIDLRLPCPSLCTCPWLQLYPMIDCCGLCSPMWDIFVGSSQPWEISMTLTEATVSTVSHFNFSLCLVLSPLLLHRYWFQKHSQ